MVIARLIDEHRRLGFRKAVIRYRLCCENLVGCFTCGFARLSSGFLGHGFQKIHGCRDNPRFSGHLKSSRSGRPRVVATQQVLLGRWNVAISAVCKFNHHGLGERTLSLYFQAGQCVGFIGSGSDGDVPNTYCLYHNLGRLHLVQKYLLSGIHFEPILGSV